MPRLMLLVALLLVCGPTAIGFRDVSAQERSGWLGISFDNRTIVVPPNPYRPGELSFRGAAVTQVVPGGPGAKAGLRPNDTIISFNGTEIREASDLPRLVGRSAPGATVDVVVVRWQKEVALSVTLGSNPNAPLASAAGADLSLCDGVDDERMRAKCRNDLSAASPTPPQVASIAPSRAEGLRCLDKPTLLEGYNCQVELKDRCQVLATRGEAAACRALTKTEGIADDAKVAHDADVERGKRLAAEATRKPEPPAAPPVTKGPPARGCEAFVADYEAARRQNEMEARFPMPTFEVHPAKAKDGRSIAVARNIPNAEFYLACTPAGRMSALDVAGLGAEQEDANRLYPVMTSALSAIDPSLTKAAAGELLFDLMRKTEDAISADSERNPATATRVVNGYAVRVTTYRTRALRFQLAADPSLFLADGSDVTEAQESGVLADVDDPDLEHWRCDARDPDGRIGMADAHGDKVNRSPPFVRPGECIVRAQPVDLVRSPKRLLNRTIEMSRMGCYRHYIDDYRCIPFGATTLARSGNQLVVMAGSLSDPKVQRHVDQYCSTMRRGMVDGNCNFQIQFTASDISTDHTETIRIIRSPEITVK